MTDVLVTALSAAIEFPQISNEIFRIGPIDLFGMTIGPFALRWYAMAYVGGLLLGWRYMVVLLRQPTLWGAGRPAPLTVTQADDFLFWAAIAVILGGRIGFLLFYMLPSEFERGLLAADPLRVFKVWEGGMSFHGGLIGIAIAVAAFAQRNKVNWLSLGDLVACAGPIGLFFGRLANFINAELYGRPTDAPWGVRFPQKAADGSIVGYTEPRHPSQLYEAFLEGVVLFAILWFLINRRGALARPGFVAGAFLAGYGVFRALVELVREPDAQMPEALRGYITMGMLLCLPMIAIGVWLMRRAPAPAATPKPA